MIDEPDNRGYVRDRDVESLATCTLKLAYRRFEFLRRYLQQFVLEFLIGLQGEKLMYER